MRTTRTLWIAACLGWSCSFALDFDDETDLPCPCLPDFVCLKASNRCVRKGSTELYKSCTLDTEVPDDLCPEGARCISVNGNGPRCLPTCTPTNYSTPESSLRVASECAPATTCWPLEGGGGVCSEGLCDELANTCPPPQKCIAFNGAGVCFTPCPIFKTDACVGATLCHPIGESPETACIQAGNVPPGESCDDLSPCMQADGLGRPLICDRPMSNTGPRRCLPGCTVGVGAECVAGESCQPARTITGATLGVCM